MKKIEDIETIYPSLFYDVYYYICRYEFDDIKLINKKYYDIVRKQINKETMITDQDVLQERKKTEWLYDDIKLRKVNILYLYLV